MQNDLLLLILEAMVVYFLVCLDRRNYGCDVVGDRCRGEGGVPARFPAHLRPLQKNPG